MRWEQPQSQARDMDIISQKRGARSEEGVEQMNLPNQGLPNQTMEDGTLEDD